MRRCGLGLFAEGSPKILGIAGSSVNPRNRARLFRDAPISLVRQEIALTPRVQHILVTPGDLLAVRTEDSVGSFLTLTVQELSDAQLVALTVGEPAEIPTRRYRIFRGVGFAAEPKAPPWRPTFAWSDASQALETTDNDAGPIPISDLWFGPRYEGCYVSVRYSNMVAGGVGKIALVEPSTRSLREAQVGLANVEWSEVQFLSHGDMLGLESGPPQAGESLVADIEVTPVPRVGRLAGRYEHGL